MIMETKQTKSSYKRPIERDFVFKHLVCWWHYKSTRVSLFTYILHLIWCRCRFSRLPTDLSVVCSECLLISIVLFYNHYCHNFVVVIVINEYQYFFIIFIIVLCRHNRHHFHFNIWISHRIIIITSSAFSLLSPSLALSLVSLNL